MVVGAIVVAAVDFGFVVVAAAAAVAAVAVVAVVAVVAAVVVKCCYHVL